MMSKIPTFDATLLEYYYMVPHYEDIRLDLKDFSFGVFCQELESIEGWRYGGVKTWHRYFNYIMLKSQYFDIDLPELENINRVAFPAKIINSIRHRRECGTFLYSYPYLSKRLPHDIVNWEVSFIELSDPFKSLTQEINSLVDIHETAFIGKAFSFVPRNPKCPIVNEGMIYYDGYYVRACKVEGIEQASDFIKIVKKSKYNVYDRLRDTLYLIKGTGLISPPGHVIKYYIDYDWDELTVKQLKVFMLLGGYKVGEGVVYPSLIECPFFDSNDSRTGIVPTYPGVKELPPVLKSTSIPDIAIVDDYEFDMRDSSTYTTETAELYVRNTYEQRVQAIRLLVSSFRVPQNTKFLLYGDGAGTSYTVFNDKFVVDAYDPSPMMIKLAEEKGNAVKLGGPEVLYDDKYKDYICFISHVMNVDPTLKNHILQRGKTILYETARFNGFTHFYAISDGVYVTKDLSPSIIGTMLPVRRRRPPNSYHDFSRLLSNTSFIVGIDLQYPEFLFRSWRDKGISVTVSSHYMPKSRPAKGIFELAVLYGHTVTNNLPNVLVVDSLVLGLRNLNVVKGYDTYSSLLITDKLSFKGTFARISPYQHGKIYSHPVFWEVTRESVILPLRSNIKTLHRLREGDIVQLDPGKYQISGWTNSVLVVS